MCRRDDLGGEKKEADWNERDSGEEEEKGETGQRFRSAPSRGTRDGGSGVEAKGRRFREPGTYPNATT